MKNPRQRILVAGIGNAALGDDAFGGEVIRYLLQRFDIPKSVRVQDFGIDAYRLARAIGGSQEAVFLIDAAPRGDSPGTVYFLEFDHQSLGDMNVDSTADAQSIDPVSVLQLVHELSRSDSATRLYLLGCETAPAEGCEGIDGLSPAVAAAVPCAAEMVRSYLARYFKIHLRLHRSAPAHPVRAAM